MCGIVGIISKNKEDLNKIEAATQTLSKRGPDNQNVVVYEQLALGHARLSIIDTTESANQPFTDESGRYIIVFNGEIFNFLELKADLIKQGITFKTNSDTEVLLYLFIKHGKACLEMLNGFFAFVIFDKKNNSILSFNIDKTIDRVSLFNYFQFNYIPANNSIFTKVKKLKPAHFIHLTNINQLTKIQEHQYYSIPYNPNKYISNTPISYENAQKQLHNLLDDAVQKRLISDVPIGTFLSGGIDSSVISTIAKRYKPDLNTFSIGYKDEPFFDETNYANLVAKKIGSNHHAFSLSNNDLYENLDEVLDYIDEPFADSSAIAVYILSKYTKKHVTVALSGDGADEIFSGYNKHAAEFSVRNPGLKESLMKFGSPLWNVLPKSRNHKLTNINRQLYKFSLGAKLSNKERYWLWASINDEKNTNDLFINNPINEANFLHSYHKRKNMLLNNITIEGDINEVFYTDTKMVLLNDMLKKVDSMSMANSLEIRTPFLDYRIVDFAFSLPVQFKIDGQLKKKILQDAFRKELPEEIYNRPKHGFEVPLLSWFKNELKSTIENDLLSDQFILEQGIFNVKTIQQLKKQLFSNNPNDAAATVWALIVFNTWWKKYLYN
ncbi:MAG: asparagine synthase (glutamine-hydrolyzing) [Bacteroidetes bacterium]|nr:asparagine synthase (glutamine-hydrolyzing) [Bacteroidota bacterium]